MIVRKPHCNDRQNAILSSLVVIYLSSTLNRMGSILIGHQADNKLYVLEMAIDMYNITLQNQYQDH